MHIYRRDQINNPLVSEHGEIIYELIGRAVENTTDRHSVAYVILPPGKSSLPHFHPEAEESYYLLKGRGLLILDGKSREVGVGDLIFIKPEQIHQIQCRGEENLEFLAICVPAWEPDNSVFIKDVS